MAHHTAAVTVAAPLHQVYQLYTHFNDYPKFMSFVREVTYLDETHSHWVVDVVGEHAWDAVNEDWVADERIGWRSVDGLENSGRVRFEALGPARTRLTVEVDYTPPAGILGTLGEALGAGGAFERRLQRDLDHFASMVEQAPSGALDPTSSAYLFHGESAAARGRTTQAQDESMGHRPGAALPDVDVTTAGVVRETLLGPGETPPQSEAPFTDRTIPRIPGTSANRDEPA